MNKTRSVISYQLSVTSYQLSDLSFQFTDAITAKSSFLPTLAQS
ncbi:MAG: hypothetical protein ACK47N_01215 [Microcystis sp.]|nr:hypothetical protein [Microcystis aeruginosa]